MAVWDLVQQMQLRGMRKAIAHDATDALHRDRRQEERVDGVESRVDEVHHMAEALWEVLVAKLGCTEEDLVAALQVIEERKKEHDQIVRCAQCGAAMRRADPRCQFCGAQSPGAPPPALRSPDRVEF